jgi:hypothetical protein
MNPEGRFTKRPLMLWRLVAYEYEHGRLAIDIINGGPLLR